jgi:hypothetical protein
MDDEKLTDPATGHIEAILRPREPDQQRAAPAPERAPSELYDQLEAIGVDVGGLIARVDQLETMIRRVDRQVIMIAGSLAIILWVVKQTAMHVGELQDGAGV